MLTEAPYSANVTPPQAAANDEDTTLKVYEFLRKLNAFQKFGL
jgi:hypothetical protein